MEYIILPFIAILLYGYIMEKIGIAKKREDYKTIMNFYSYYKHQITPNMANIIKWAVFYGVIEEVVFRFIPIYFLGSLLEVKYIILVVSLIFALLHFLNIKVLGKDIVSIYGKDILEEEKPVLFFGLFLLSNYLFNYYLYNPLHIALIYSIITHIIIIIAVGINKTLYLEAELTGNTIWWSNSHKVIKSPIMWLVIIIPTCTIYINYYNCIAFIINIAFIVLSTLAIYIIALYYYSTDINVLDGFNTNKEKSMLKAFFTYPIWALIQQIIVITVFLILIKFLNPIICIVITSVLFGMVHIRNKPLAVSCLIMESILLTLFYFHKNIYILAISHGWIATCGLYMLPSSLHNNFNI